MKRLLVDSGPLVAWLDDRDGEHQSVRPVLETFDGELLSTWPVLTEVCHLLPEQLVHVFMRWVGEGGLTIVELPPSAASALADRMGKYADLPMDLADASLIWLAESLGVMDILTLDRRDVGIYRTDSGKALRNVLETVLSGRRRRPIRR